MEDLRKKFIIEENLEEKKLAEYIERILPFCKVSKKGEIMLEITKATTQEKTKLGLVARFLANRLDGSIPAVANVEELTKSLDIPKDQVTARLKELKDNRFAFVVEKGSYRANPLEIGKFLSEIEKKYGTKEK